MKANETEIKNKINKTLTIDKLNQLSNKSPERILDFLSSVNDLRKEIENNSFSIDFLFLLFSLINRVYNDKTTNKPIIQLIEKHFLSEQCSYFNTILQKIEIKEENTYNILYILDTMFSFLLSLNKGIALNAGDILLKIKEQKEYTALYRNVQNKILILQLASKDENVNNKENSIAAIDKIDTIKVRQLIPKDLDFFDSSFSISESVDCSQLTTQIQTNYNESINSLLSTEYEICYKFLSQVIEKHRNKLPLSPKEKK